MSDRLYRQLYALKIFQQRGNARSYSLRLYRNGRQSLAAQVADGDQQISLGDYEAAGPYMARRFQPCND